MRPRASSEFRLPPSISPDTRCRRGWSSRWSRQARRGRWRRCRRRARRGYPPGRRIIGRPIDPAAEGVALRNSVEHQQRPARCVAAKRAQRHSLARRMATACIGAAEQLDAGDILQQLVELVARRLLDLRAADPLDRIDAFGSGFGQRLAGNDDCRRRWRKRRPRPPKGCRRGSRRWSGRRSLRPPEAPTAPTTARTVSYARQTLAMLASPCPIGREFVE